MEKKVQRNFYGLPYWYWEPSGYLPATTKSLLIRRITD